MHKVQGKTHKLLEKLKVASWKYDIFWHLLVSIFWLPVLASIFLQYKKIKFIILFFKHKFYFFGGGGQQNFLSGHKIIIFLFNFFFIYRCVKYEFIWIYFSAQMWHLDAKKSPILAALVPNRTLKRLKRYLKKESKWLLGWKYQRREASWKLEMPFNNIKM